MAMRKSTRGVHSSRNRSPQDHSRRDPGRRAALSQATGAAACISEASIDDARMKLMRAGAVLDCTCYVLLYADRFERNPERPSFSDAVAVARDLVREVVDALDRVNLRSTKAK